MTQKNSTKIDIWCNQSTWEWSLTLAQLVFVFVWGLLLIETFLKNLGIPAPNGFSKMLNWNWGIFDKEIQESYLAELLILTNHISYKWKGLISKLSFSLQVQLIKQGW